jgi:hypothetical protein
MALLGWDDLLGSPDLVNETTRIQSALAREGRAIPAAAPELRRAVQQEGARLSRLREIEGALTLANRRLALQEREQATEEGLLQRYANRLPYATAIGVGNVLLGGLSAYGNMRAGQRSDARTAALQQFQLERSQALAGGLENLQSYQKRLSDLYQKFLAGQAGT